MKTFMKKLFWSELLLFDLSGSGLTTASPGGSRSRIKVCSASLRPRLTWTDSISSPANNFGLTSSCTSVLWGGGYIINHVRIKRRCSAPDDVQTPACCRLCFGWMGDLFTNQRYGWLSTFKSSSYNDSAQIQHSFCENLAVSIQA